MLQRAVFFDMDDTLLDGQAAMRAAWDLTCGDMAARLSGDATAIRAAIRVEADAFWHDEAAMGHWRLDLDGARAIVLGRALDSCGLDSAGAREFSLAYAAAHREHLHTFDDAYDTLDALRSSGLRLALLTNGPAAMQRDKVERFGFEPYFDAVVIEGEFGNGKPHERVFRHALAVTGALPEDAWHIGDNLYADIGGAQAVGVHAVWIHRDRLELKEGGPAIPDRIIGHLPEIREPLGLKAALRQALAVERLSDQAV
jgi:putative hydrolase of the HAD superfamily